MATVYLGLGSNIGDTEKNLREAVEALAKRGAIASVSSLYRTEPVGFVNQPWFLNQVICLETKLSPEDLLKATQQIENNLGRERTIHWGPRTIDIDILLYDNLVMATPNLTIPHSWLSERRFVLEPLAEIAPTLKHPILEKTLTELLQELKNDKAVVILKERHSD